MKLTTKWTKIIVFLIQKILLTIRNLIIKASRSKFQIGTRIQSQISKEKRRVVDLPCHKWRIEKEIKWLKIWAASYSNMNNLILIKLMNIINSDWAFWNKWRRSISRRKNPRKLKVPKKLISSFSFLKDMKSIDSKMKTQKNRFSMRERSDKAISKCKDLFIPKGQAAVWFRQ